MFLRVETVGPRESRGAAGADGAGFDEQDRALPFGAEGGELRLDGLQLGDDFAKGRCLQKRFLLVYAVSRWYGVVRADADGVDGVPPRDLLLAAVVAVVGE